MIVLNNKCNLEKDEFINYLKSLETINHELILCPSTINIPEFNSNKILLGAQNVSKAEDGPHTGEVSAKQLSSYGVKYCIIGHSERRIEEKETNRDINKKIKRLQKENITPILCVGETKEERRKKVYKRVINQELREALVNIENVENIIIAYEPIYSIGTGIIPKINEIEEIIELIKKKLPNNKVLYGGSVSLNNKDELSKINSIDGYLIGGLGLHVEDLNKFLN